MKTRCYNPKQPGYANYGGRGITVCEQWRDSFDTFLADMGRCPPGYSLDRKDNDHGYEPENCRWAAKQDQVANRRNTRHLTLNGDTLTLAEWARRLGVPYERLKRRLQRGWPIDRVLAA